MIDVVEQWLDSSPSAWLWLGLAFSVADGADGVRVFIVSGFRNFFNYGVRILLVAPVPAIASDSPDARPSRCQTGSRTLSAAATC